MTNAKKELLRSVKFIFFSISAGLIQIAAFTLMEEVFHVTHWVAYLTALALSVLQMTAPQQLPGAAARSRPAAYTVRDKGGRVAVYPPDGTETVYDIYVNLLPEQDVLRLRQGIPVESEEALQQLLEDLGG